MDRESIRLLHAYNDWANDRVLALAIDLPPGRATEQVGAGFGSIRSTLTHMMHAEIIWLGRWRDAGWIELPPDDSYDVPAIAERWREHRQAMSTFLSELTPELLIRPIAYTNAAGHRFEELLWQLMLQVVIHGAHHRSEVAEMLTRFGRPPPPLDFVHYLRGPGSLGH